MTEEEIRRMEEEVKEDQEKDMEQQEEQAALAEPGYGEAGGQESAENVPPTANENKASSLEALKNLVLEEDKKDVISRIIKKQHQKTDSTTKK